MWITIYLLGVCISASVWFAVIKWRQKGNGIPMPDRYDGWYLDPLDKNTDYSGVMIGWFLISVLWPLAWFFILGMYVVGVGVEMIRRGWNATLGNEKLAKKILGPKENKK